MCVRGALSDTGHVREPVLPVSLIFVTAMMCLFSVVIAFFKDIPDVRGDRMSSIRTLSVRFGVRWWCITPVRNEPVVTRTPSQERTVLNLCIGLLLSAYTGYVSERWCGAQPLFMSAMWSPTECDAT
jgi:hypothetical protein